MIMKNRGCDLFLIRASPPGPLESEVMTIKSAYFKILQKKYGEGFGTKEKRLDEYEANFVTVLDARIKKYHDKNN